MPLPLWSFTHKYRSRRHEDNFSSHSLRYLWVNDLKRQWHFWAWPLYILFKCDVRHGLHCLVLTDNLFKFTNRKTYLVNQRWRHTTCLQHPCYDVGCYLCCKQFGPRSGSTKCRSWSKSKPFNTLIVFLKEFFEKKKNWRKSVDGNKSMKMFPVF